MIYTIDERKTTTQNQKKLRFISIFFRNAVEYHPVSDSRIIIGAQMFTDIAVRLAQMGFDCARGNIQKFGYFLV